jgi:hypothetical protein
MGKCSVVKLCGGCNAELKPALTRTKLGAKKYCTVECQTVAQRKVRQQNLLDGKYIGKELAFYTGSFARLLMIDMFGYKCNACGISEWNGKEITLEANHIDGKSSNNSIDNLEFLCPNCHSQTPTFRALNKNNATRLTRRKKDLPA